MHHTSPCFLFSIAGFAMHLSILVWAATASVACLTSAAFGQVQFGDRIQSVWQATSPRFAEMSLTNFKQGFPQQLNRDGKSFVNTFPFNAGGLSSAHDHGQGHGQGQSPAPAEAFGGSSLSSSSNLNRSPKQQVGNNVVPLDIGTIAAAGEKCVDKVVMVEETEYDDEIHCKHSYSQKCHLTYATDYEPQQEEECEDNFKKRCFIEYKNVAKDEPVRFCFTPLVRNCNIPGPIECTTEYRSECTTT